MKNIVVVIVILEANYTSLLGGCTQKMDFISNGMITAKSYQHEDMDALRVSLIFFEKNRPLVALLACTFCCYRLRYVHGMHLSTKFLHAFSIVCLLCTYLHMNCVTRAHDVAVSRCP